jgi:hypothetical protein
MRASVGSGVLPVLATVALATGTTFHAARQAAQPPAAVESAAAMGTTTLPQPVLPVAPS